TKSFGRPPRISGSTTCRSSSSRTRTRSGRGCRSCAGPSRWSSGTRTMGRYSWPGTPRADGPGRGYLGPALSALLHPNSRCHLKKLRKAFLLYTAGRGDGPQDLMKGVILRVARGRKIASPHAKFEVAAVEGITDPTDFESIIKAVERWVTQRDPFEKPA